MVEDIFEFDNYSENDFVLLNSMFHFAKKDKKREADFIKKIISNIKKVCLVIFCIQDTGKKVEILNETIDFERPLERIEDKIFTYVYEDQESNHRSETEYQMIIIKK